MLVFISSLLNHSVLRVSLFACQHASFSECCAGLQAQAALSGQLVVARQQHADVCLQLQKDHAALQQAALQEHALQKVRLPALALPFTLPRSGSQPRSDIFCIRHTMYWACNKSYCDEQFVLRLACIHHLMTAVHERY